MHYLKVFSAVFFIILVGQQFDNLFSFKRQIQIKLNIRIQNVFTNSSDCLYCILGGCFFNRKVINERMLFEVAEIFINRVCIGRIYSVIRAFYVRQSRSDTNQFNSLINLRQK